MSITDITFAFSIFSGAPFVACGAIPFPDVET
nr:MAG TPA: hypothetical protein [Caudoviricetes sp.]